MHCLFGPYSPHYRLRFQWVDAIILGSVLATFRPNTALNKYFSRHSNESKERTLLRLHIFSGSPVDIYYCQTPSISWRSETLNIVKMSTFVLSDLFMAVLLYLILQHNTVSWIIWTQLQLNSIMSINYSWIGVIIFRVTIIIIYLCVKSKIYSQWY